MLLKYTHFVKDDFNDDEQKRLKENIKHQNEFRKELNKNNKEEYYPEFDDERDKKLPLITKNHLSRLWTPRKSFIKEDEIDRIDLEHNLFEFTMLSNKNEFYNDKYFEGKDFLFDWTNLLNIPKSVTLVDRQRVPFYKITKKDGEIIEMVVDVNISWNPDRTDNNSDRPDKIIDKEDIKNITSTLERLGDKIPTSNYYHVDNVNDSLKKLIEIIEERIHNDLDNIDDRLKELIEIIEKR